MASLYRKPVILRDPKTGQKIKTKSKKWWGRLRDENGREKRVPLATDKAAAQAMLTELVRKMERKAAGIDDPLEKHRKRRLKEHLVDFVADLNNRVATPDYVNTTEQRVAAILEGCKFERIDQISASRVQEFLAGLRKRGKSVASSNHYLRAIKMFTRWLVRDHRMGEDRLAYISALNVDVDRRRIRRPLTTEEFTRLIEAVETGPKRRHLSGLDRAILYIIGAYTGYRRNEIGSVSKQSFNFDSDPPTLTVQAGYSKHRRTDVLPVRKDFAERIRRWIAGKPNVHPNEPLLRVTNKRTADMLEEDLAAAREKWIEDAHDNAERQRREQSSFLAVRNEQGHVVDFHSLRMTFITNLTRSGVAPKTAQMLARHSDINLTMNTYTMLGVMDQAAAIEALPPIPSAESHDDRRARPKSTPDGRKGAA